MKLSAKGEQSMQEPTKCIAPREVTKVFCALIIFSHRTLDDLEKIELVENMFNLVTILAMYDRAPNRSFVFFVLNIFAHCSQINY